MTLEKKLITAGNPRGIIAMNGSKDMCVLACMAEDDGNVTVIHFDKNLQTVNIDAHVS